MSKNISRKPRARKAHDDRMRDLHARDEEIVENIGRRGEGGFQLRMFGGDIKAVGAVEIDEVIVIGQYMRLPFAVRLLARERFRRLGQE